MKSKFLGMILGALVIAGLLPVSNAFAVPSSGSCSMLITKPVPYGATVPVSATYNILAILTFTSTAGGTFNAYVTHVNYTATGVTMGTSNNYTAVPFTYTVGTTGPDTITATLPGGAGAVSWNVTLANGGNTILMQATDGPGSGVCQF